MAHVFLTTLVLCLTYCLQTHVTAEDTTSIESRILLFVCSGTGRLSTPWLKPAFDIAMETVEQSGLYSGFHFNVSCYELCRTRDRPRILGFGAELYYRQPYNAIIGPPTSSMLIGKFLTHLLSTVFILK